MPPPDRTLTQLIVLIAFLNALHLVDHLLRGDFHWPIDQQSVGFVVVATIILGGSVGGLWFYRSGRVGPMFWTVVGTFGLGLGWYSHFSPMTDQSVSVIFRAYQSSVGGVIAVACLLILMLAVLTATVYAWYLWIGRVRH